MSGHPFRDVAIVGIDNTAQALRLEGFDTPSITVQAAVGALADAGVRARDVDGVVGNHSRELIHQARCGPAWHSSATGIAAVLDAARAIACGMARIVVIASGFAEGSRDRASTAPWVRPANEFVAPYGMYTAAEFALVARRHMHDYGTTAEAMATVAATIRNNGHVHPQAVYQGRGPFTAEDVLASRMVAEPFHLLECAMTSEGGCAVVLTHADVAADLPTTPVYIVGGNCDAYGPSYEHAPSFHVGGRLGPDQVNGWVGRHAAQTAWRLSGLGPRDVDVCELYDPFSFEIIRQLEAFGFCAPGEGGDYVMDGTIEIGGRHPITTDGGTMAFSHARYVQLLQRVARAVEQLRGTCATRQVPGAQVAMCSNSGAGAMRTDVLLLGTGRPT